MSARRPLPWCATLVVALTLSTWLATAETPILVYDRAGILRGEIWRLWTGHLVHFSTSHLVWDLVAAAFAGVWIERAGFRGGRWLWVIAPPMVSLIMMFDDPALARYGGLSAMATSCVVFACLGELQCSDSNRLIWWTILALVTVKIFVDFLVGKSVLAHFEAAGIQASPSSHAAGALAAVWVSLIFARQNGGKIPGKNRVVNFFAARTRARL